MTTPAEAKQLALEEGIHPAYANVLMWFEYTHLPEPLQMISHRFHTLAWVTAVQSTGPEGTIALRKLLEAKDAAVRARLEGNPLRRSDV